MRFLGREQELSALEREYKRDGGFVVVYGRRRVGKTTLIKEFIKGKNALYFLANEESDRQNLNKFTEKVADFTQQPHLAGSRLESWQSAFRMLAAYQCVCRRQNRTDTDFRPHLAGLRTARCRSRTALERKPA